MSTTPLTRRPGAARDEGARRAILHAASELIARDGYDHLTIEGIAARAGVGKPTIYRWWSSKSALIAECLMDAALLPDNFVPRHSDDLVADITQWLEDVIRFLAPPQNAALIRSLIAASVDNRDVADQLSNRLGATPESLQGRLQAAVDEGVLRPDTAVSLIVDMVVGAIIFRVISDNPIGVREASLFVRAVLAGALREPSEPRE